MKRLPKSVAKVVVLESSDPILSETEAIQSRIRQRAFEISQRRPQDSQELFDWIMAESEIISVPPAELIEKDSGFEMRFAVVGVSPGDVNLMVTPNEILLKSDYSHQHDSDGGIVHLCDFKPAIVFRTITLPQAIDVNSVKVDFADGLILVRASKQGANGTPKRASRRPPPKKSRARTT